MTDEDILKKHFENASMRLMLDGPSVRYELLKMAFEARKEKSIERLIHDAETLLNWINRR